MIRILHSVSNMDRAGIETMLMNYYRHIDRSKIQFDFLCNKKKPGAYDAEIKEMGGNIYHTPGLNPAKYPSYLKCMKKIFEENPLKGKVYCGYCQKLMKYRVLKKLGPSFNCRFSATAVDSPCKRIPISEKLLEEIVRNALTAQIKQAEHILEILHERERKALICFSALERQEEKMSAEKAEIVKQRVALYEQYANGNISKEEFIRQRDAYRVQEDDKMEQIQMLRTEKDQIFLPVRKDADNLQTVVSAAEEAGDVMHLSQNVVETFIDRIEVFNDERVKIRFTFEDALNSYEEK